MMFFLGIVVLGLFGLFLFRVLLFLILLMLWLLWEKKFMGFESYGGMFGVLVDGYLGCWIFMYIMDIILF